MDKVKLDQFKKNLIDYAKIKIDQVKKDLKKENLVEIRNIEKLFSFFTRGKFVRSYLIKKIFNYYSQKDNQSFYDVALSLELFHSSILIHDDVFDNDYLRRGKKTIFYQYNSLFKKNKDDHLGKSLAIILGDLGFYLSNLFLWQGVKNHKNRSYILESFFYQVIKTALGEFLDVKSSLVNDNLSFKKISLINRFKTAEYTFNLPFKLGYYLAVDKPNRDEIRLLEKIGFLMGDIYQIKDDLLNILGNVKITGKSIASDIKENKNTIIKKVIFNNLSGRDKKIIQSFFGNKDLTAGDLNQFKKIFFKKKIDQKIFQILENKKQRLKNYIDKLNINEQSKKELMEFTNYLITREK